VVRKSVIALAAGIVVVAVQFPASCQTRSVGPSKQAAVATAIDLNGETVSPFDLAAGKALVLIFVRTDCPISNRYAPQINATSLRYKDKVQFVLVYPDKSETPASIQSHLQEYGYKLPALRDPQRQLVKLANAQITPEVAVFGSNGALVYHGRIDNWYEDFGRARPAPTTHELNDAIVAALSGGVAMAPQPAVGCYISDLQ
jgi:thiol-disulfide isomerase/thioredoxin